ncbi:MAG: fibronectin type III domain-containing protein, partial [Gemmatimonadales bacterium]
AAVGAQIPTWPLTKEYPPGSGNTFTDTFVGADPSKAGTGSTSIPAPVVGLHLAFPSGGVTDAGAVASDCGQTQSPVALALSSPVFQNSVDGTQYGDAFVRASFSQETGSSGASPGYHLLLTGSNPSNVPLTVPSGGVISSQGTTCGTQGFVDGSWLENTLEQTVIPQLTAQGLVSPATFPVFLMYDTAGCLSVGSVLIASQCFAGEHLAYKTPSGATQTFAIVDYSLNGANPAGPDSEPLAHEVTEWMDDPFGDSLAPTWGYVGQLLNSDGSGACSPVVEVADPLAGTSLQTVTTGSTTYHISDAAFPWWFFRDAPAPTATGKYSYFGTFTSPSDAAACPAQPISVTAVAGDGSATVSWTEPAVGSSATDFVVCAYAPDASLDLSDPCPASTAIEQDYISAATTETIDGLANGTSYVFRVFALHCVPNDCSGSTADISTPSFRSAVLKPTGPTPTTTTTSATSTTTVTTPAPTVTPSGSNGGEIVTAASSSLAFTGPGTGLKWTAAAGAGLVLLGGLVLLLMVQPGELLRRLGPGQGASRRTRWLLGR